MMKSLNHLDHLGYRGAIATQLISGKDNAAKVDNFLGKNHLVVCGSMGQLNLKLGFELVTPGIHEAHLVATDPKFTPFSTPNFSSISVNRVIPTCFKR